MRRNKQEHRGFYNATQGSVTNMNLSMWKLISLLMKEEILARKKTCDTATGNKSISQKKKMFKHYEQKT